jgi:hypothetical protein
VRWKVEKDEKEGKGKDEERERMKKGQREEDEKMKKSLKKLIADPAKIGKKTS